MNESKISVRYSKALLMAAENSHILSQVADDMASIAGLCRQSDDFLVFLQSTVIKTSSKKDTFNQIFKQKIHPLTLNFLLLLAENHRESKLPDICRDFHDMYREKQGIAPVVITTAFQLNNEIRQNITRYLQLKTGKKIELTEKVKPEIIGGLVLRIGDLQYDGSISNQLRKVREELSGKEIFELKN